MAESRMRRETGKAAWRVDSRGELTSASDDTRPTGLSVELEPLASRVGRTDRRKSTPRAGHWSFSAIGGAIPAPATLTPKTPRFRSLLLLLMAVLLASVAIWTPADLQTVAADLIGRHLVTDIATSRTSPGPAPLVGQLDVTSAPSGIKLYVDGEQHGVTPAQLVLRAGYHDLTFVSPLGQVRRQVRIRPGRLTLFSEAIFQGTLTVSSEIELEVRVDGKAVGTSGDAELLLPPGSYQVELVNPGDGARTTHAVEILPGQVTPLDGDGMHGN